MRIKRKNGLKIAAITIPLLLCLALAVGITGAWYQAKRQATGTLSMDQGIIIDYKGFGQTPDEGIWTRETTTTFLLFNETNAQPGEQIAVNAAGIRANEKSVNFYARVKLSYKFYNGETPVELADATKLIKTSSSFWANSWVDGGSSDGYYYYATGSTLNKFEKGTQTFVDLFATDAKFVIEGAGFTGADNNGEGGGFKIDETTSINKIEVYLTLETLQGDATAEQAKALGWKISSEVDFAKVDEGKIVKSNTTTEVTDEKLNVTINDKTTSLETVKFPYDEEVILNFDSRNVDYITLKYSTGAEETFGLSAEDFANDYLSETALKVAAKSSKGTVKGYTVGLWDSEYTGFSYSKNNCYTETYTDANGDLNERRITYEVENGIAVSGYWGSDTEITIESTAKVRQREMKWVLKYNTYLEWAQQFESLYNSFSYPCTITTDSGYSTTINSQDELMEYMVNVPDSDYEFPTSIYKDGMTIVSQMLVKSTFGGTKFDVKEIGYSAFFANQTIKKVTIQEGIIYIGEAAFAAEDGDDVSGLEEIILPNSVKNIADLAFARCALTSIILPNNLEIIENQVFEKCKNLTTINIVSSIKKIVGSTFYKCEKLTITVSDLDGTWVYAEDGTQTINGVEVEVKKGDVVDSSILLNSLRVDIEKQTV